MEEARRRPRERKAAEMAARPMKGALAFRVLEPGSMAAQRRTAGLLLVLACLMRIMLTRGYKSVKVLV